MLVAYVNHTRPAWHPLKTNKESMWESLRQLMNYYLALDSTWWNIMVARLLDHSMHVPERPNNDFEYMPRRSLCQGNTSSSSQHQESRQQESRHQEPRSNSQSRQQSRNNSQSRQQSSKSNVSPPRQNRNIEDQDKREHQIWN